MKVGILQYLDMIKSYFRVRKKSITVLDLVTNLDEISFSQSSLHFIKILQSSLDKSFCV